MISFSCNKSKRKITSFVSPLLSHYFTSKIRGVGLPHIKQFCNSRWVSHDLTQFWHDLPEDSISSHRWRAQSYKTTAPTSEVSPLNSPLIVIYTSDSLAIHGEVPNIPSFRSFNLLEHFTELRKAVYLLDNQFIIKRYNSRTAWCKRYIG